MKFSFLCSQIYGDTAHYRTQTGWPVPPAGYRAEIGERSTDFALDQAALAEELGFDMVSVSEHHYWPSLPTPNPAVLAAALTQRTSRVRIGWMGPLVSIGNPLRVAEEAAMLDQLSHGRLDLLLLRGTPNEFVSYNTNPAESRGRTQEAIALITKALTEPQPFGWQGRYYRYPTISVWPGVSQHPHPPIYGSGNSPESVRYAVAHGHKIGISFYPSALTAKLVRSYQDACAEAGRKTRPSDILYRAHVAVAETERDAKALADRYYGEGGLGQAAAFMGRGATVASELRPPPPTELGTDADGKNREADAKGTAAGFALGKLDFFGTPDTVVRQLTEFSEESGVGLFDLGFSGGGLTEDERARSLTLFGREVMPKLRHLGADRDEEYADAQ
ncbi:LLM class flavin-dependent oxidoreductase [Amycolatopsis sp. EV170708-02-1]|uniref:LLM class flavin-dependent oxidoreductase n=1 Tax=Amycolatopsis sp. EV170708-02-1 TaxID=2919322 RepID=UPI001F0C5A1D|nr:LLM class flavin-dependent oxidoreductase [Amycolatopsis sp. EV170708-02-1]UMP03418.1 LLM class flavin-dependent oxidoreductase [Amycolatopsis sp. EV170708-02-1]